MEGIDADAGHGRSVGGVGWWLLLVALLLGRGVSRLVVVEGADDSSGLEGWAGGSGEGAASAACTCTWWLCGVWVGVGAVVGGGVRGVDGNVKGHDRAGARSFELECGGDTPP